MSNEISEREVLEKVLREHQPPVHMGNELPANEYECCADAILAAGYRLTPPPSTVTSVEALAAKIRADMGRDECGLHDVLSESDLPKLSRVMLNGGTRFAERLVEHPPVAASEPHPPADRLSIVNGYLVECANECTCYGGGPYGHEPGCGYEPLVNLAELSGWPVAASEVEGTQPGCTGDYECPAPAHQHGCLTDNLGHCNEPGEHSEPDAETVERVWTECAYLARTVAARYRMVGKHGDDISNDWLDEEISKRVSVLIAALTQGRES